MSLRSRVVVGLVSLSLMSTLSWGALVGLQWKDSTTSEFTIGSADGDVHPRIATVHLYVQQVEGDTAIVGVGAIFDTWLDAACTQSADYVIRQSADRALLPQWRSLAQTDGYIYAGDSGNHQYMTAFASGMAPGTSVPGHAGKYVLAEADLIFDPLGNESGPTTIYLTFNRPTAVMHPYLIDPAGNIFSDGPVWNAELAATHSGYLAYGEWGNPGWQIDGTGQLEPTPLVLHVNPEPASILLLVLGGAFTVQRRSAGRITA